MSTLTHQDIEKQLRWRYATKQFDPNRPISEADLHTLLSALVLAPSSFGLQPWKFVVVKDPAVREQLVAASWNQKQVKDASHLIVIAARKHVDAAYVDHFIATMAMHHKTEPHALKAYRDVIVSFVENPAIDHTAWAARQAYIALGFLMETAAMLKIDTCPMEGLDPRAYDRILNIDPAYGTVCACPIGHRAAQDKYAVFAKVRFDASEIVEYR